MVLSDSFKVLIGDNQPAVSLHCIADARQYALYTSLSSIIFIADEGHICLGTSARPNCDFDLMIHCHV